MRVRRVGFVSSGLVVWSIWAGAAPAGAVDGVLDTSFSSDGMKYIDFGLAGADDLGTAVAVDSRGRVVVAGRAAFSSTDDDFGFARFLANGDNDTSFDSDALQTVAFDAGPSGNRRDRAHDVAIQRDGKIVACGTVEVDAAGGRELGVVRLLETGALDTSFSGDGKIQLNPVGGAARYDQECSIVVRASGAIAVGWTSDDFTQIGLFQLTATGVLDAGFGFGGLSTYSLSGVGALLDLVEWDGDTLVGTGYRSYGGTEGEDGAMFTTTDGLSMLTTLFDGPEASTDEQILGVGIQSDGRLILGMRSSGGVFGGRLVRVDSAFDLDPAFGASGWATVDLAGGPNEIDAMLGIAVQSDDRIVAHGYTSSLTIRDCVIERFDANGQTLDATFGSGGRTTVSYATGTGSDDCFAATIGDGRFVAGGFADLSGDLDFTATRLTSSLIFTNGFESADRTFWSASVP